MALVLYGSALSSLVRKIRVVLHEKGLTYRLEQTVLPTPGFAAMSPLKRIPVLRDTDLPEPNTMPESSVIADYIEHKWPQPPLYPVEPFRRAQVLWLEEYSDSHFAKIVGSEIFQERVMKKRTGGEPDESAVAAIVQNRLPAIFDYFENTLGGRRFLVDDTPSVADIAVASVFVNLDHSGERVDARRWPRLARFVGEMHGRPSFKPIIERERQFIAERSAG